MKAVRYLLCPGWIKYNGQEHFISAGQLKTLYGVNWEDCDVYKPGLSVNRYNYIRLFPRYDGDYSQLPSLKLLQAP